MKDLNEVASNSRYLEPCAQKTIHYSYSIAKRYMKGAKRVLEMGPAEGLVTKRLLEDGYDTTVVEGSSIFASQLRRLKGLHVIEGYFEEIILDEEFDFIILGHVLEHVDDPVLVLRRVKHWLSAGGKIFCSVPNVNSLHRQMALEMGLISKLDEMSEKDIHHGHLRHYSREQLISNFEVAGFEIHHDGGYWAKVLPDSLIDENWTEDQIDASFKAGELIPEFSAEIWCVAKMKD